MLIFLSIIKKSFGVNASNLNILAMENVKILAYCRYCINAYIFTIFRSSLEIT